MNVRVSVCIPVYGVEKYIEKCARTLFEQTLREIEYIFVDDCTPDRSIEILQNVLEDYPHRKEQVKIIHHEKNGGLVAARNTALKHVSGEYVIHCDSDDWVELDMYETMYNKAKETDADMVYCDFINEYSNGRKKTAGQVNTDNSEDFLNMMYSGELAGTLCNKLYRRQIALCKSIESPTNIIMGEDHLRNTFMLPLCTKIVYVHSFFYHYFINSLSYTHNENKDWIRKKIKNMCFINSYAEKLFGIRQDILFQAKCNTLIACINAGNASEIYKQLYPECKRQIFRKKIPLKTKMTIAVANLSYHSAYLLLKIYRFARHGF